MRNRLSIVLIAIVLAVAFQGCVGYTVVRGSGRIAEEDRRLGDFDEVALAGQGTLHITVGRSESLRIEAEHNLLRYLETEVHGDRLHIGVQNGVILRNTRPIHYYLTVKDLDTLVLSGSGKIVAPDLAARSFEALITGSGEIEVDDLEADDVRIRVSGSGNLSIDRLEAGTLDVDASGSGDVAIARGEVAEQNVTISGSGKYAAEGLDSEAATARISGSGVATIRVSEKLDARITGSGNVRYVGRPVVETHVTGSGDVQYIGG